MRQEDPIRAQRDAYREQAVDCLREALVTVPGSAAQARAIREGLLCAGKAEALSRFLGETTEEMPRDRPEVFSVD